MSPSAQDIFSQTLIHGTVLRLDFQHGIWRMVQHGHCHIWIRMDMSGFGVDEKSEKIINKSKWVVSEKEHG